MDFGISLNFRNPKPFEVPFTQFYEEQLQMVSYCEELGFDTVWLPEHHFSPGDGYNPVPVSMAAAVAARTEKIKIGTWIALLPLYHPVRLAEEAVLVDLISGGRFELGVGLGYRKEEFEAYGISRTERGARMEEGLTILRGALGPEQFSHEGRFHQVTNASVWPRPIRDPFPIWVAARSAIAAERAARHDASLMLIDVGGNAAETYATYADGLRARGRDPKDFNVHGLHFGPFFIDDDPERARELIRPYVEWELQAMDGWYEEAAMSGHDAPLMEAVAEKRLDGLPQSDAMVTATAAEAIASIEQTLQQAPYTHLVFGAGSTTPAGMPLEKMKPYLERFATEVIPHFRNKEA